MIYIERAVYIRYDKAMDKPKKKLTKKEYAYNLIKERILDGTYAPGHRVVINQLAKELAISAIPVREAMNELVLENLVQYKPYSGAVVTPIDEEQYLETLSVLAVLAGYATALSASSFPKEEISVLMRINREMQTALDNFDFSLFGKLNRDFHQITYKYCGNDYLLKCIAEVQAQLDTIRRTGAAFVTPRARESIIEHEKIIVLLKTGAPFSEIEMFVKKHKLNTVDAFKVRNKMVATKKYNEQEV